MQGDEVRALDVLVRLLGLSLKVDGVGQSSIEHVDHFRPNRFREIVLRLEHFCLLFR